MVSRTVLSSVRKGSKKTVRARATLRYEDDGEASKEDEDDGDGEEEVEEDNGLDGASDEAGRRVLDS